MFVFFFFPLKKNWDAFQFDVMEDLVLKTGFLLRDSTEFLKKTTIKSR